MPLPVAALAAAHVAGQRPEKKPRQAGLVADTQETETLAWTSYWKRADTWF